MKNKIFIFITLIGLIGLMSSCEKDGTRITMSDAVISPALTTIPDLTLLRENSADSLQFVGTPVDPGFEASATYYIEASTAEDDFENPVLIYTDVQVESMKMTVSDINTKLLDILPEDQQSSAVFRLRCQLVVDGGTGAPGTGEDPFEYVSVDYTENVTVFGLLRLDLLNSGMDQKIVSPFSDGVYTGFVKLAVANPFTLHDPDNDIEYGGAGGTLIVDGADIIPAQDGWHRFTADTEGLTYNDERYSIGLIGSAVPPYDWSVDIDMEYDPATKTWFITQDLDAAEFKFRLNDGWAWNLGTAAGSTTDLVHDGANIPVAEAGNYTITLSVSDYDGEIATFTMVKN